jgi:hypothetical protein
MRDHGWFQMVLLGYCVLQGPWLLRLSSPMMCWGALAGALSSDKKVDRVLTSFHNRMPKQSLSCVSIVVVLVYTSQT